MLLEGLEPRLALAIDGLAVAGDSWSDEHAAEAYNYSQNWAELLRTQRGIDLGAPGNYPDIRGANGTAFNWAMTDATALQLLIEGQDIMILDQFNTGDVSHAVLMIGNSDFAPGSEAFTKIADGSWSQAEIDNQVVFISTNIKAAISTLATVPIRGLVTTIADPTLTPQGKTLFTAAQRAKVTTVVNTVNSLIREYAAEYHLPLVDIAALATTVLGTPASPATSRTIGGNVYTVSGGTAKTNLFVQGGVVPHTVFNALVANAIIEGLNFAYNENIAKFTEQQIVTLAGQTYGGTDTFPINYASLIIQPPVTVFVDFGKTSTPSDDFTARMSELATARGIAQLSPDTFVDDDGNPATPLVRVPGELSLLKAAIASKLQAAFAGTNVNVVTELPTDTRFETVKLGRLSSSVPGALTSLLGQSTFDWLNASETSIGLVFPDLIPDLNGATKLDDLPRAQQLRYLENILSFYVAQEAGRGMGLSSADAYGYSQITSANAANTGGVQFQDFMSGAPALGFDINTFHGTPAFRFSPLAQAKLQFGRWLTRPTLTTVAEVGAAHDTTASAQVLSLTSSLNAALKVATVKGARIATGGQKDLYRITAAVGDLITAQTIASGVYGAPIDTVIRLLAADGATVLATSDNTLLGNNSIGQTGTTNVDSDSLILNHVAATAGNYFIEVTANAGGSGDYDLFVGNTVANNFPWQNPNNPLNVNNNTTGPLITAFDALAVINELNNPQIMDPVTFILPTPTGSVAPPPYLDVNGSNTVTAFDALPIINWLNLNPIGATEFVPFAAEAVEEPASAGEAIVAPPSESSQAPKSAVSKPNSGYGSASSEDLTWLLLTSPTTTSEVQEADQSNVQDERDAALEEILNAAE